jgi:hypothetical protein
MNLKQLINKSVYGTIGYISSQDDLDLLESYILYNLPVLKEFKNVVVATNYGVSDWHDLQKQRKTNFELWRKYFPECILIDSKINRGHNFGTADLDDAIFDYCKENNIEWLCKSANDIILQESILDKEIEEADFYYLNGIGYGGASWYDFNPDRIVNEYLVNYFYPQTNFYFINVSKTDYLNDKEHVNEIYNKIQNIPDYNGKAWEYGFRSCETLLKECVKRNNLFKYHLVSQEKYRILSTIIQQYIIYDSSHKNIMIEGICHFSYPDQKIIKI